MLAMSERNWIAPLTGVLFFVLAVVRFAMVPYPPVATEASLDEMVTFFEDVGDRVFIASLVQSWAAVMFLLFAAVLFKAMRATGADASAIGMLAGATVFTAGTTLDATIYAAAERAVDVDPVAMQTLLAFYDLDWLPATAGMTVFLIGWGAGIISHGGLPAWMGWVMVIAGLQSLTPYYVTGTVALAVAMLAVLAASIKLTGEARKELAPTVEGSR